MTPPAAPGSDDDIVIFTPKEDSAAGRRSGSFFKRVPKAVWIVSVIVAAGAAALFVFSSFQQAAHSPQKVAAEFRSAMDAGDFSRLSELAQPSDSSIDFTAETAAPMFALYNSSSAFRRDVDALTAGAPSVFHLKPERHFLYTGYTVSIDACELTVHTNIAGASVTAGGQTAEAAAQEAVVPTLDGTTYTSDYANLVRSSAKLANLLPGVYTVNASYTTSFGESFETSVSVSLMESAETALNFSYASVYVWNTSDLDVELSVGGRDYGSIASNVTLQLAPLHPDTAVTAACTTASGEKMTSSVTASDSYFEIRFAVGKIEIYNDYDVMMDVAWADDPYCSINAKSAYVIDSVPVGTKLTCSLEGYDIFKPFDYQVQYDYDSICPILDLSDESSDKVALAISDYLTSLGPDAPETPTSLSADLQQILSETHLMSAALAISNITIDNVYDVEVTQSGVLIRLNGSYDYTLPAGITLPPAEPAAPDTGDSADDTGGASAPDAGGETGTDASADAGANAGAPADSQGSGDSGDSGDAGQQTTFTQKFDAALFYDGTSWTIQG